MNSEKLHYNTLSEFSENVYHGFISSIHLKEEVAIRNNQLWLAEYNKMRFLLTPNMVEELPIVVTASEAVKYRGKIYRMIEAYKTVKVTPEKRMSFRELIDWFDFKLADELTINNLGRKQVIKYSEKEKERNKIHFLLFKIFMLGAEIGRVNFRVSTSPGFGKDSMSAILGFLMNDVASTSPRSVAAIEYRLFNKLLVLNELSALESSQRDVIWKMLEMVGDYKNTYEKSTRATSGTFDKYDISNLSLVIFYNRPEDYAMAKKEDKFFDNIFGAAIQDRFIPFRFEGTIDKRQFKRTPPKGTYEKYKDEYLAVLKTIYWYRENYLNEVESFYEFIDNYTDEKQFVFGRHPLSFYKLAVFVALYAKDKDELKFLLDNMYEAYQKYYGMTEEKQKMIEEIDATLL